MKTACTGPPVTPVELDVGLEGAQLAAERVARGADVEQAQMIPVEHDHARARAKHWRAAPSQLAERVGEALALDPERHHRRLPAGNDQRVEPFQVGGHANLDPARAERRQILACASKSPCSARIPTVWRRFHDLSRA